MHRSLALLFFAALVLLVPTAAGQDIVSRSDRFKLFNACRPMQLAVSVLTMTDDGKFYSEPDHEALSQGEVQFLMPSEKAFQEAAESRLRVARLYTEDILKARGSYLRVDIFVVDGVANLSVAYSKEVTDEFGTLGRAETWRRSGTSPRGSNAIEALFNLSSILDGFLVEYLRVNEEACEAK